MQVTPMWMPIMMPVVDVLLCSSFTQSQGTSNTEDIQDTTQSNQFVHYKQGFVREVCMWPSVWECISVVSLITLTTKDETCDSVRRIKLGCAGLMWDSAQLQCVCGCVWLCQIITRFLHRLPKRNKSHGGIAISVLVVCKQLYLIDQWRIWTKRKDRKRYSDNQWSTGLKKKGQYLLSISEGDINPNWTNLWRIFGLLVQEKYIFCQLS